jgi:hypothetical protein
MHHPRAKLLLAVLVFSVASLAILITGMEAQPAPGKVVFRDNFSSGKLDRYELPYPEDWAVQQEGPLHYLHMLRARDAEEPRHPIQFARLKGITVGSFTLETRVRREHLSVAIAFNYVDAVHFYYTHLSVDAGAKVAVHNGVFLVDGAPRRRIGGIEAPPALPDTNWHKIRLARDVNSGSIKVFVDNEAQPHFSLVDKTFKCGQIGLGSFDETGDYTDVKLSSNDAGCRP